MTHPLTSPRNPRIQRIRALQNSPKARREADAFVVEGIRLLEEALRADLMPETLLAVEELPPRAAALVEAYRARGVTPLWVTPRVFAAASDTRTPQGLLAVFPKTALPLKAKPDFLLLLDGIRDPGNLGTILRTALAAGVDGVLLPPGNADPYAPKVVRAAMGAHFRLPLVQPAWEALPALLGGLPLYLAEARRGIPYTEADFRSPCALLIGGEAAGPGAAARALSTRSVHIPMPGPAESLNAAVAAAVLLFEVVRQRGRVDGGRWTVDGGR
ncbi:MAG TPA: RNA methyltransferase [Chloroflexi bacterium]|nr:RNA methyltransferase [Chloroflexota bacterium]